MNVINQIQKVFNTMNSQQRNPQINSCQKIQESYQYQKIDEQKKVPFQETANVQALLHQNERILIQIKAISKYRKNKNTISPNLSLLTNKLQRNLVRIARLVPPVALVEPDHIKDEKQRFLKFYRGRNLSKKTSCNAGQTSVQNGTPNKNPNIQLPKQQSIQKL